MIPNSLIQPIIDKIKDYLKKRTFDKSPTKKSIENDIDKSFDKFEKKLNILLNKMFDNIMWEIKDENTKKFLQSFDKNDLYNDMDWKFKLVENNDIFKWFIEKNIDNNKNIQKLKNDFEVKLLSFKKIFDDEVYNYTSWKVNKVLILKEKEKLEKVISSSLIQWEELLWKVILKFFDDLKVFILILPVVDRAILETSIIQLETALANKKNIKYYEELSKIIWELFDDMIKIII